jgi:hypothetical protein
VASHLFGCSTEPQRSSFLFCFPPLLRRRLGEASRGVGDHEKELLVLQRSRSLFLPAVLFFCDVNAFTRRVNRQSSSATPCSLHSELHLPRVFGFATTPKHRGAVDPRHRTWPLLLRVLLARDCILFARNMKREQDVAELLSSSLNECASPSAPRCTQRTLSGKEHGFPTHPYVVEEMEEVTEYQTILLRFPCFDFFRHVHLCETTIGEEEEVQGGGSSPQLPHPSPELSEGGAAEVQPGPKPSAKVWSGPRTGHESRFAPQALQFVPNTLATDTPVAVLNGGTANEMIFEGQWCEVAGDGTAVTNRAVLHLSPEKTTRPAQRMSEVPNTERPSPPSASFAASPVAPTTSIPVASLLPHAAVGVTADEERRARTEDLKGWVYDRVDVPTAVLVMRRVR